MAGSLICQTSHRHHYLLTVALTVPREKLPRVWHPFPMAVPVGVHTEGAVGQTRYC